PPFKWPGAVVDTTYNKLNPPSRSPPNQAGSTWLHVTSETEQVRLPQYQHQSRVDGNRIVCKSPRGVGWYLFFLH
ncbi:hypothetical protein JMJ77_0013218, partial [Colletotrichum scovillei]